MCLSVGPIGRGVDRRSDEKRREARLVGCASRRREARCLLRQFWEKFGGWKLLPNAQKRVSHVLLAAMQVCSRTLEPFVASWCSMGCSHVLLAAMQRVLCVSRPASRPCLRQYCTVWGECATALVCGRCGGCVRVNIPGNVLRHWCAVGAVGVCVSTSLKAHKARSHERL